MASMSNLSRVASDRKFHTMAGMSPEFPWWHPFGHSIGFLSPADGLRNPQAWQVSDDRRDLRRIVPEAENRQGAGAWSLDGRRSFFLGGEGEVFLRMRAGLVVAEEASSDPLDRQWPLPNTARRRSHQPQAALCRWKRLAGRDDALRHQGPAVGFLF